MRALYVHKHATLTAQEPITFDNNGEILLSAYVTDTNGSQLELLPDGSYRFSGGDSDALLARFSANGISEMGNPTQTGPIMARRLSGHRTRAE